jgi:Fusaric acid resistance protein-like
MKCQPTRVLEEQSTTPASEASVATQLLATKKINSTAKADSGGLSSRCSALRTLFAFNDGPWRWAAGVQAGFANALPIATFSLTGHLSLGLVASVGAFTALYGTTMPLRERLRVLPLVAMGFVAASVLGVLCAANAWLTIACMTAVALLACMLVVTTELGPPGPMQFVLVAGVSARLAYPEHLSGAFLNPMAIPALVAVGAISAYIVVAAPLALPLVRSRKCKASAPVALFSHRIDAEKSIITARVVLAVAVAGLFSVFLRVRHGYWMVMVAGAVLQMTYVAQYSAIRAVHRVLGTVLGVVVFGVICLADPRGAWLIAVVVLLQFAIEVVVARHYALALAFITPTALTIAAAAGTTAPGSLVAERIVDTFLGATIAMIVLWTSEWIMKRNYSSVCCGKTDDHGGLVLPHHTVPKDCRRIHT